MNPPSPDSLLVDRLVADLAPVDRALSLLRSLVTISLFTWFAVGALVLLTGGVREGAIAQWVTAPRSLLEFLLGGSTALAALVAGLEIGVPGKNIALPAIVLTVALSVGWLGLLVYAAYGASDPGLSNTSTGRRPLCALETVGFSMLPILFSSRGLRSRALFSPGSSVFFLGLAGAAVPATWMQLACVDQASHALTHHLLPAGATALVAGLIGRHGLRLD